MKTETEKMNMKPKHLILIPVLITCLALTLLCAAAAPKAFGVVPAPDGGYPGFNTAEGQNALFSLSTGQGNTAVGWFSLKSDTDGSFNTALGAATLLLNTGDENTATGAGALLSNTTGIQNTANGVFALLLNTTGSSNTATGDEALFSNTTGLANTATGFEALFSNTTGGFNTANGNAALGSNTTGGSNTATGDVALFSNSTGSDNTAVGAAALGDNTTGNFNTATGVGALRNNTEGELNTANGNAALLSNTTGDANTAIGDSALLNNTTGGGNTASGDSALLSNISGEENTAIGVNALNQNTTGNSNTALGVDAGTGVTTADNVICIRHPGANVSDSCYIGNIFGANVDPSAVFVVIDANGKLGTTASSRRFKEEIQPMDKASEALLSLKPVTFRYKNYKNSARQFGLIAEEVAEVNPDLVARDKKGEIYTVRYDQINAMLLNEFLKEHRKVEKLEATVAQQQDDFQSKLAAQEKQIAALASGLQKVSARLAAASPSRGGIEIKNSVPQVVMNSRDDGQLSLP
jgi:trimeric autotransporter adhesin